MSAPYIWDEIIPLNLRQRTRDAVLARRRFGVRRSVAYWFAPDYCAWPNPGDIRYNPKWCWWLADKVIPGHFRGKAKS